MKISELIEQLQRIAAEHGDVDVEHYSMDYGTSHIRSVSYDPAYNSAMTSNEQ